MVGFGRTPDETVFVALPDAVIEHPAISHYRFIGGHRLWRAPEEPAVTYHPDDDGTTVRATDDGVVLTGAPDGEGIVKEIAVTQRGSATVVDHALHNTGPAPVTSAPWAITQLAVGGTAILPQTIDPVDPDAVLPNRHLVLWPYTDLEAPELSFTADTIEIEASPSPAKLKVGWPNRRGWLGYALDRTPFVKWASVHDEDAAYVDFGASAQCYRDGRFLELETLGPSTTIPPGGRASHREVWELFDLDDDDMAATVRRLPGIHPALE